MGSAAALSSRFLKCLQGWRFPNLSGDPSQGCTRSPWGSFFPSTQPEPSKAQFVSFASCHTISATTPVRRIWIRAEFGSVTFSTALQVAEVYYYIVLLPPGRASALLLAPRTGHSSLRKSPTTSCWMLAGTWHLSDGVTAFANKPRSIRVCVCGQSQVIVCPGSWCQVQDPLPGIS